MGHTVFTVEEGWINDAIKKNHCTVTLKSQGNIFFFKSQIADKSDGSLPAGL